MFIKNKAAIGAVLPWGLLGALSIALFVLQCRIVINHDVAYYLFAAEKLLAGGGIPNAIYDVNPPLIILLSVPPVALAHMVGAPIPSIFVVYVFALALLSFACALWALRATAGQRPRSAGLLLAFLLVITLATAGYDFGQRGHLICILCLPYLCVVASRWAGGAPSARASVACVTLAALGFFLKPQFLILPLVVLALMSSAIDVCDVLQASKTPRFSSVAFAMELSS